MDYVELLKERLAKARFELIEAKALYVEYMKLVAEKKCKKLNAELKRSYIIDGDVYYPLYSYTEYEGQRSYFLMDEFRFCVIMIKRVDVTSVAKKYMKQAERHNKVIDELCDGVRTCYYSYEKFTDEQYFHMKTIYWLFKYEDILDDGFMEKGITIRGSE